MNSSLSMTHSSCTACCVSPAQDPTRDLLLTVLDLVIPAVLNDRQNLPVQFV